MGGGQQGPDFYLLPVQALSLWLSQLQAGSFFILLPEREFPALNERLRQECRNSFWEWRRWEEREEAGSHLPGLLQGMVTCWKTGLLGRSTQSPACFWAGK